MLPMKDGADRTHEVPYLAGSSKSGGQIYIDRRFPQHLRLKDGRSMDVDPFITLHEAVEKAVEDHMGYAYPHAHHLATVTERAAVEKAGYPWDEYQAHAHKYVHKEAGERYTDIPANIDTKPEHDEHDKAMLVRIFAAQPKSTSPRK